MVNFIAFIFNFMASDYQFQVVIGKKFLGDICTKSDANSALAWVPSKLRAWIAPQHFTKWSILGWLAKSIDTSEMIKFDTIPREKSTMNHENLPV